MADPSESIQRLKIDRSAPPPAASRWPWLVTVAGIAVVGTILWVLVGALGGAVEVETDVARKPPSAAVASSVLDASGYVVARRQATISSKVTGKVLEVLVEEGMRVEKDQIVARLDDTTQQAQLAVAIAQAEASRAALEEISARLRNARQERERQRGLAGRASPLSTLPRRYSTNSLLASQQDAKTSTLPRATSYWRGMRCRT